MNNKQVGTIIASVIVIVLANYFTTKSAQVEKMPTELATLTAKLTFAVQTIDELKDDLSSFRTELRQYVTKDELETLDDRFKSEKSRRALVEERHYTQIIKNQESIRTLLDRWEDVQ